MFGDLAIVGHSLTNLVEIANHQPYSTRGIAMSKRKAGQKTYLALHRPFVGLPNDTILSEELNNLNLSSRWLYMVLLTRFNRENEKCQQWYRFTYEELTHIISCDDRTLSQSIKQLESNGFIEVRHGGKNNPSEYRPVLKHVC